MDNFENEDFIITPSVAQHFKKSIDNYMDQKYASCNLGRLECIYLGHLLDQDGVSLIDLTKISHLDKANTTRAINDLEQKGYVVKRANEKDSRKYKIYITDKTREIAEKLNETRIALNKKAFKGITKAEKKNFIKTFHKICKNLDVL
jgi:DNA-binding MarR family transcriptional regulator